MTNDEIAAVLERIADLLEAGDDNPFRIQSYRDGARSVRQSDRPLAEPAAAGDVQALKELPNIGEGLARVVVELARSGRSTLLEDLQARVAPADVLRQVPGIGPRLAQRIVDELGVRSLPELEQAAHDGRLAELSGFGARRLQSVRDSLETMLRRRGARWRGADQRAERPTVATLLAVDDDYRSRAAAGELRRIAPKRFNPEGEAWLPIMRSERDGWRFTALFSNTARAHELNKTDDWVVIYYEPGDGDGEERQNTVVTETSGPLQGRRVVRGRAAETRAYYQRQK